MGARTPVHGTVVREIRAGEAQWSLFDQRLNALETKVKEQDETITKLENIIKEIPTRDITSRSDKKRIDTLKGK